MNKLISCNKKPIAYIIPLLVNCALWYLTPCGSINFSYNGAVALSSINAPYRNKERRIILDNSHKSYSYIPSISAPTKDIHCGEIVLGRPIERNDDGSIVVDVGLPKKMIVPQNSMLYMNTKDRIRFSEMMNVLNKPKLEETTEEMIEKTLEVARTIPNRKRKTYIKPKYYRPNDFKRKKMEGKSSLSYDLGVGGELKPRKLSLPLELGNEKDEGKMEFLVTQIDPYAEHICGEFFSVDAVESKRRIYLAMMMDSVKSSSSFVTYDAIIKEKHDKLLKLELIDSRFMHICGLNAFTLAKNDDEVGDIIKVYLAGADAAVEHVYFFRTQVSHHLLHKDVLKSLFDEILRYYIKSGIWFKGEIEKVDDDALYVRILGDAGDKIYTTVLKQDLPYTYSEDLIYETFTRLNTVDDYFRERSTKVGIGKVNHCYHYDNTLYVRVVEYLLFNKDNIDTVSFNDDTILMFSSCRNIYKPEDKMEYVFKKIATQKIYGLDLKLGLSYPCLLVGYNDDYIYFAINYKFKENFTLNDECVIGVMETDRHMDKSLIGTITHAQISDVCNQNIVNDRVQECDGKRTESYKVDSLTNWLKQSTDPSLKNINSINLLMMKLTVIPGEGSPQLTDYFPFQPIFTESTMFDYGGRDSPILYENKYKSRIQLRHDLVDNINTLRNLNIRKNPKPDIGTILISNSDHAGEIIAPPILYTDNEEMREYFIKGTLGKSYSLYRSTLKSSHNDAEVMIHEFFVDSKGRTFWDMLEKLKDPSSRKTIELKEALYFERSVKQLLPSYQNLHIDPIYENADRADLMFATIAPKSHERYKFFQTYEIEKYLEYLREDILMDRNIWKSVRRTLEILIKPSNLFMRKLRTRHRRIPNKVFFYLNKTRLYDSFYNINELPSLLSTGEQSSMDLRIAEEEDDVRSMMPFPNIAREPNLFGHQLQRYGLSQIRKMYNDVLAMNQTTKLKYPKPVGFDDEGINCAEFLEPSDFDDPELLSRFEPPVEEMEKNSTLRITSKEWRRLNKYPKYATKEDIIDFLINSRNCKPVHGLKIPIL